jgi:phosphopantothenate synthetase
MVNNDPCTRIRVILENILPVIESGNPAFPNFVEVSINKLDELEQTALELNIFLKEQKDVNKIKQRFNQAKDNIQKSFAKYKAVEHAQKKREENPMYV